jgi:abortive infection bacteriophage resistance protein
MAYKKPFLNIQQQIALLKSRGLTISDEPKAKTYLERIGYYRLSGYSYPFRSATVAVDPVTTKRTTNVLDDFQSGTEFRSIVELYVFDKKLRLLLLDAIERIEIAIRVQIALQLGQRDPWAHRNPAQLHPNFSGRKEFPSSLTKHQEWLKRTDKAATDSKEEFAKHFKATYPSDYMPIWIACELWDFGALSFLYSGLLKPDQTAIARKYGIEFQVMESWLRTINVARNTCAHHARLWNKPTVIQPRWPSPTQAPLLNHIHGNTHALTRLYGSACILQYLLSSINPTTSWANRLKALCKEFPKSSAVNLRAAGFPPTWETEVLWT